MHWFTIKMGNRGHTTVGFDALWILRFVTTIFAILAIAIAILLALSLLLVMVEGLEVELGCHGQREHSWSHLDCKLEAIGCKWVPFELDVCSELVQEHFSNQA